MSYHFSNFEPSASSRMDFFDTNFHENVSSDFLTLLSQENTFQGENDILGSHPSYLSTKAYDAAVKKHRIVHLLFSRKNTRRYMSKKNYPFESFK